MKLRENFTFNSTLTNNAIKETMAPYKQKILS